MRVLVADPIAPEGTDLLQRQQVETDVKTGLKPAELLALVPDYDGLIVRSETQVTREVLAAGRRLQVVGRAGVGVDNIDVGAATDIGIVVVNAPSSNTIAAAEHTVAMMLALARHIPQAHASLQAGRWERRRFVGTELRGKVLGIVGLGRIGAEVARRAAAFGMRLLGFDPFISVESARHLGVELVPLAQLMAQSDFITLHTPLTEATRALIGSEALQRIKPGAAIINCARGGIVDEEALYRGLVEGRVGGAALDVFSQEPPQAHPLLQHPRVIVTPHLGASTVEAQANVALEVAQQVLDVLQGRTPPYAVNAPLVGPEALAGLTPYIPVALAVGALASQMADGQPAGLAISYRGEVAEFQTAVLKAAVLRGFLERSSEQRINVVNADLVARRRGLHVEEHTGVGNADPYSNLLTVEVTTSEGRTRVAATLMRNEVHIVQIDAYRVDMVPTGGPWLILNHRDRPGMIGAIGTITGENDINIASMQVSREASRGPAMTVLGLDEPITPVQVARVAAIPDVHRVRVVHL
ncbi:MAG: phosphoglycerate dehydrogenase [Chloroflexi bacterium]|nr:phosphoglycerate dehydrogenase [Chloroflexota bacterium]